MMKEIPVKEKYLIKKGIFKTKLVNKELAEKLKNRPTGKVLNNRQNLMWKLGLQMLFCNLNVI